MTIVISQRFISNLKFIYNYKKSSKYNIYGYFIKLFLIFFTQIHPRSINRMPLSLSLMVNDKRIHILKYIILPSIFLSIIALVSTNQFLWISSAIHHFYIELFGTLLAGILSFYYISRANTLNDKFSLFIGIGFLVNTIIDLLHVIVSLLNMDDILFLKYFIPQTWFAGRLFLSAMLAIAIVKYVSFSSINSSTQQLQQQQKSSNLNTNKNNENINYQDYSCFI